MPRWSPFEPYFWSLVEKGPDCWQWQGDMSKGYGRVHHQGKRTAAHRVAWLLVKGPIPEGLFALHSCDNRRCVKPDHIFLGTQVDNMQDWTKKGKNRLANDPTLWSKGLHMKKSQYQKQASLRQQHRFSDGVIASIRDSQGRYAGTKVVS